MIPAGGLKERTFDSPGLLAEENACRGDLQPFLSVSTVCHSKDKERGWLYEIIIITNE